MAEFDPDEFIKKGESFDPDRFISGSNKAPSDEPGTLKSFAGGVAQGALFDPVTGINQLIEHATDNKIGLPDSVKNWLEDYKEKYTSGTAGQIGEGVGTVGSLFVPGGIIAKGLGVVPKAVSGARMLTGLERAATGAGVGAAGSIIQPVNEDKGDFSRQKGLQALGGTLGGGLVGPISGPAAAGGTAYLASKMIEKLGWPASLGLFAAMGSSLASLAHHHGLGQAGMKVQNTAKKIFDRPGAQIAAGRAAGAGSEPAQELLEDNQ